MACCAADALPASGSTFRPKPLRVPSPSQRPRVLAAFFGATLVTAFAFAAFFAFFAMCLLLWLNGQRQRLRAGSNTTQDADPCLAGADGVLAGDNPAGAGCDLGGLMMSRPPECKSAREPFGLRARKIQSRESSAISDKRSSAREQLVSIDARVPS